MDAISNDLLRRGLHADGAKAMVAHGTLIERWLPELVLELNELRYWVYAAVRDDAGVKLEWKRATEARWWTWNRPPPAGGPPPDDQRRSTYHFVLTVEGQPDERLEVWPLRINTMPVMSWEGEQMLLPTLAAMVPACLDKLADTVAQTARLASSLQNRQRLVP